MCLCASPAAFMATQLYFPPSDTFAFRICSVRPPGSPKDFFFLLNAYYQEFCFHAKALPWLTLLFFTPPNVSQSHGTWHDECIAIRLDGAPFISPAECGRGETSGFTREGHKVVHHHTQRLRVWPNNGGRHWGKGTMGEKKAQ